MGGTPSSHGGGYLIQSWWGVPKPVMVGVPHPVMVGVPPHHQDLDGVPPIQTWMGYPPPSRTGLCTPTIQTWLGYPHHPGLARVPPSSSRPGQGTPHHPDLAGVPPTIQTWLGYPPPSRCRLTNKLKTVPSPILRMQVVIISESISTSRSELFLCLDPNLIFMTFLIKFFLNKTNLTFLAFLYKIDITGFQNKQKTASTGY